MTRQEFCNKACFKQHTLNFRELQEEADVEPNERRRLRLLREVRALKRISLRLVTERRQQDDLEVANLERAVELLEEVQRRRQNNVA